MTVEILISRDAVGTRIARTSDGHLTDIVFDDDSRPLVAGTPVLGRIRSVVDGLNAAFVDIGDERDGFLPLRELDELKGVKLHEGAALLVAVGSEALENKGARLTSNVNFAGELFAFIRGRDGLFLSRQITDEEVRAKLTKDVEALIDDVGMPEDFGPWGCIVRTAAADADLEDLEIEFEELADRADAFFENVRSSKAPAILTTRHERIRRVVERLADASLDAIHVNDPALAADMNEEWEALSPGLADALVRADGDPFDVAEIDDQIEEALEPRVELPSGAWITIEPTEALTAIDVNTGSGGGRDQNRSAMAVNLEAAHEIARQVRLRGIGGLIVVDFLKLREDGAPEKLMRTLNGAFVSDQAPVRIAAMSEFGVVELTRRRDGPSLVDQVCEPERSRIRVPSVEVVGRRILTAVARERRGTPGRRWVVNAAPEVVAWLEVLIEDTEDETLLTLALEADEARARDDFAVVSEE